MTFLFVTNIIVHIVFLIFVCYFYITVYASTTPPISFSFWTGGSEIWSERVYVSLKSSFLMAACLSRHWVRSHRLHRDRHLSSESWTLVIRSTELLHGIEMTNHHRILPVFSSFTKIEHKWFSVCNLFIRHYIHMKPELKDHIVTTSIVLSLLITDLLYSAASAPLDLQSSLLDYSSSVHNARSVGEGDRGEKWERKG